MPVILRITIVLFSIWLWWGIMTAPRKIQIQGQLIKWNIIIRHLSWWKAHQNASSNLTWTINHDSLRPWQKITFDCSVYVRFYDAWKYLQIDCLIYEVLASYCSRRRNLDFKLWMTGIAKSQNNYSNMWHNNRCTFDVCKIGQLSGLVGNDKENRNTHLGLTCLLKDS